MATVPSTKYISIEDYLSGEPESRIRHEYLGGVVYAMAGGNNAHNLIATNLIGVLHFRLRGRNCRAYNSDTKIRLQLPSQTRFYYPDASVICQSNPPTDSYQDRPNVIAEVMSRATRRIDEGEKKDAYLTIASLSIYMLVEQEIPLVTLFRRQEQGFVREVFRGMDSKIPLPEIGIDIALSDIYEGVEFQPEPVDEET